MATDLDLGRDVNSGFVYARQFSDEAYGVDLDASTEASLSVPTNAKYAIIGYEVGVTCWVSNATITIPTANTFSANAAVQNPLVMDVSDVTTMYFISESECTVDVSFFR